MLVGRSVHNQRIERLWRDVYIGVTKLYHDLFLYMEAINVLDPTNETHLFSLHFVYLPRIKNHLHQWKRGLDPTPITYSWQSKSIATVDGRNVSARAGT